MRERARRGAHSAHHRLSRLEERLADARRARAGHAGSVVAYADDDLVAIEQYVEGRERLGGVVVVIQSLAPRSASEPAPWA